MAKHLQRDLEGLKREILAVGTLVEEATHGALRAVLDRRAELAEEVIARDALIDEKEVAVEDECLKILALHQPVAADLRFVVAVLKVNNDLERMGDLATNIAKRTRHVLLQGPSLVDFTLMGEHVTEMLQLSLDALIRSDAKQARRVCALDERVDRDHRELYQVLKDQMRQDSETVERAVNALGISRSLERIADLATNIAEDVVFMVEGEVIRHGADLDDHL